MFKKFAFLLLFLVLVSAGTWGVPTATLKASPSTGPSPLQVDFSGSGCADDTAEIVKCEINLGDGNIMDYNALAGETHTYVTRGTYDANLFGLSDNNQSKDAVVQITVENQDPRAVLSADPNTVNPGQTVTFTGFCSDPDGNGTLNTCFLDYGDGSGVAIPPPFDVFSKTHTYSAEKTYLTKLMANDDQDVNTENIETVNVVAPAAPSISNKMPSTDTSNVRPEVSFDVNDNGLGVDISSLALFIDGEAKTPDYNKFGGSYHVSWIFGSDLGNGHTVYVGLRVEDDLGNSTGDVNWEFNVDTEAPSSLDIKINSNDSYTNDGSVSLSLEASGASQCRFKNESGGSWSGWDNYSTSKSWSLEGDDGTRRVYFQCKDSAGNESGSEYDEIGLDRENPNKVTGFDAGYDSRRDEVDLDWSKPSDSGSGIDHYCLYRGENSSFGDMSQVTCSIDDDDTDYEDDADDLDDGETYYYRIRAVDRAGNNGDVSGSETVTIGEAEETWDTTPPYLKWELPGVDSTVSGVVTLKVRSYDDESSVGNVSFWVDNAPVGTDITAAAKRYTLEWDSKTVADGRHTLKAIAKNRSGNPEKDTEIKTITVTTDNGIVSVGTGGDAQSALDSAERKGERADALFTDAKAFGAEASAGVEELWDEAKELLEDAKKLLADGDSGAAKEKADAAGEKFGEVAAEFSIESYGEAQAYLYSEEKLGLLLQGIGLGTGLAEEATGLLENCTVSRSIAVKRVVDRKADGNSAYYKAVIRVVLKNNSGKGMGVQVVEVVPKGFAGSAGKLYSSRPFTTVAADPIIKWALFLKAGEETEINYVLKENLSREKADALLLSEPMQSFIAPPILLARETSVSEGSFSAAATGAVGLFALGDLINWIVWIVIAIIVIAVALFAFSHFQGRKEERPFGLHSVGREEGLMGRLGGKFSGLGRDSREEERRPKWAYKG